MAWCTVGVAVQDDKRERPNLWITLRCDELVHLTPLQAREMAVMLQLAADHVEKVKEGVLIAPPTGSEE